MQNGVRRIPASPFFESFDDKNGNDRIYSHRPDKAGCKHKRWGTRQFWFLGKEEDKTTELDFGPRYYSAMSGRFLAPDPILSGASPYAYSEGNPIMRYDPTGLTSPYIINSYYRPGGEGWRLMWWAYSSAEIARGWGEEQAHRYDMASGHWFDYSDYFGGISLYFGSPGGPSGGIGPPTSQGGINPLSEDSFGSFWPSNPSGRNYDGGWAKATYRRKGYIIPGQNPKWPDGLIYEYSETNWFWRNDVFNSDWGSGPSSHTPTSGPDLPGSPAPSSNKALFLDNERVPVERVKRLEIAVVLGSGFQAYMAGAALTGSLALVSKNISSITSLSARILAFGGAGFATALGIIIAVEAMDFILRGTNYYFGTDLPAPSDFAPTLFPDWFGSE